jgi:non-ribosomal peptide synthetase component F
VEAWTNAAPASTVENLYGPTELTVAVRISVGSRAIAGTMHGGCRAAIRAPVDGMCARIIDDRLVDVEPGAIETADGRPAARSRLLARCHRDRARFVRLPGGSEMFYRTGDRK